MQLLFRVGLCLFVACFILPILEALSKSETKQTSRKHRLSLPSQTEVSFEEDSSTEISASPLVHLASFVKATESNEKLEQVLNSHKYQHDEFTDSSSKKGQDKESPKTKFTGDVEIDSSPMMMEIQTPSTVSKRGFRDHTRQNIN